MAAATRSGAAALPVRSGEQRWTEAELAKVREQLESEIAELRAEIAKAESEIAERLGDAVGDAGDDQADAGAKTFEREHELALTHNARELLAQTERALARIEAGTYGVCESCGEPIGKARLQAFPRATCACVQAARGTPLTGAMMDAGARDNGSVAESAGGDPGRARGPQSAGGPVGVAVFVLAADVDHQVIVVATLSDHPPIRLLGGLLTLPADPQQRARRSASAPR